MSHLNALRPASRAVYEYLVDLDERAYGRSLAEIAAALTLSERTVRRAARELELAELAIFRRSSTKAKIVWSVTNFHDFLPRVDARNRPQTGPNRPKPAQSKPAQTGPNRPKPAQPPSLLVNSKRERDVVAVNHDARARERSAHFEPQQQRQQLLGLGVSDDRDLAAVRAMLERLDAAVRRVWQRVGQTHGFIAIDEATVAGLELALRRYPADEIEACVVWSAQRVAEGRLSIGYFATTFRGNGFCARHRDWQNELAAAERRRRQDAAIAADVQAHREPPRQLELSGSDLERLGREALERFAGLGGGT